ncbi:acetyl-CoA hydrolase/transferase family protein [Caproiciproducens sp.]
MSQYYEEMYREKFRTPEEIATMFEDGDGVSCPTMNGLPRMISKALCDRIAADKVKNIEFVSGLNLNAPHMIKQEVLDRSHYASGYIGPLERKAAADNSIDPLVWRFFENARLMSDVRGTNVCWMTASPMDEHGYFSCALNCSHTYSLYRWRQQHGLPTKLFLEVNKNAPTCYGYNHFHISEVTALTEANWDLIELPQEEPSEIDTAIATYVAQEVPDGATIQLGIGSLPNAIGKLLSNKKDLGCHSEMIVQAYLDLFKCGALNNSKKSYLPGRCVGTLVAGSKELYKWVDRNPGIWIYGINDCADPNIIALNDNFIAINCVLEADLAGQCVCDNIKYLQFSGTGGQADFIQGSWQSKGGKAILCLPSTYTDKQGKVHSKIVPTVTGWVGVARNDVQYLCTEYGIVFLKGCTMRERVAKIISIAHPDFREELLYEAKRMNLIHSLSDVDLKSMHRTI